ncbi:tryptophan dimethylallyltransferase family protein [Streptomyces sp. NPDC048604]|uniref:tryptophan dimethylallyltransferase family protein n=1 Tax=Streptomyces sp. NPDC048604 TaxID=3365578 RepID=UPI00371F0F41
MTASRRPRPSGPGRQGPAAPRRQTLGAHVTGQLLRLCETAGLDEAEGADHARTLIAALGPVADRPLDLPAPDRSFLSDDHTPVEFSLSFEGSAPPTLRVLLEPGCGADDLAQNGRIGLQVVRAMGRNWGFDTERLDELADLFLPDDPQGAFALWCALELRAGGTPKVKVYLNPAANGAERSAATVREALHRLGHRRAFDALPPGDRHLFFALDLGAWETPRVKVYLAHHGLTAGEAAGLSRAPGELDPALVRDFFRTTTGRVTGGAGDDARELRPFQSCHAFTETASGRPSGFTLYVPVREHAAHDREALDRALTVLDGLGTDPTPLLRSLPAVTSRRLEDGVGLIAYLGLAHQTGRPPRVTAYLSSEAYEVRPPRATALRQAVPVP